MLITDNSYFFQGANFDSLTPAIERIAVQGTNLPAVSTAPSFIYVYDPESGTFVRSSGSLGPVFLERADTVGRNRLLVGLSYLHADLTNLNGQGAASQLFFINSAPGLETGDRVVKNHFQFEDFALHVNSVELSATYGLTDAWDLNVLFPLLETTLDTEATTQNSTVHLDGTVTVDPARTVSLHASSFGVGDLLVRSKYRFGRFAAAPVAGELILRAPTGREGDFQGLGDWTLTPLFVISRAIRAHDVHTYRVGSLHPGRLPKPGSGTINPVAAIASPNTATRRSNGLIYVVVPLPVKPRTMRIRCQVERPRAADRSNWARDLHQQEQLLRKAGDGGRLFPCAGTDAAIVRARANARAHRRPGLLANLEAPANQRGGPTG